MTYHAAIILPQGINVYFEKNDTDRSTLDKGTQLRVKRGIELLLNDHLSITNQKTEQEHSGILILSGGYLQKKEIQNDQNLAEFRSL